MSRPPRAASQVPMIRSVEPCVSACGGIGIHFGGVDEIDAAVEGIVELGVALGFGVLLAPGHRAEADRGHVDPGAAEFTLFKHEQEILSSPPGGSAGLPVLYSPRRSCTAPPRAESVSNCRPRRSGAPLGRSGAERCQPLLCVLAAQGGRKGVGLCRDAREQAAAPSPRRRRRAASRAAGGFAASRIACDLAWSSNRPASRTALTSPRRRASAASKGSPSSRTSLAFGQPDPSRQEERGGRFGHEPEIDEGQSEHRGGRGIDQVAMQDQRGPDADRDPVDGGNDGFLQADQGRG